MSSLHCIEIETLESVTASVIWLHGLGANGNDFVPILSELKLPKEAGIRFIFPNAPEIPVTVNAGYLMPAWYDILELTEERVINEQHLAESVKGIQNLIDKEIERGVPSDKIMLIGFSQGGAVAYHAALSHSKQLAGLLGLSTYFPTLSNFTPSSENATLPIMVCHGSADAMVMEKQGKKAVDTFKALGHSVNYYSYPMEHEVCLEEIRDISHFIQDQLL